MKFKELRSIIQDHATIWLTVAVNKLRFIDKKYDDYEISLIFPDKYPSISSSGITVFIDIESKSSEEDLNSCDGCKHYHDGDGDRTCGMCCRK